MNKLSHLFLLGISYKLKLIKPLNPPYQYSIEPTNICNFRCVFCPQSDTENKSGRTHGTLNFDNFKLFLNRIRELKPGNKNISLTLDGEPTLNKDFPGLIGLANAEGLFPRFSSNAKKLTPNLVDELVSAGSFLASVDFASEAGYFDNVRGREGDFEIVLKNLRYMVEIAGRNPKVKLEIVNISHFSGADPEKTLRDMQNLFPNDLPANIAFWSREFHNFCGYLTTDSRRKYKLCPYPWTSFYVTWEGDVVPCCRDTQARTVLGNVFTESITDIWYGERYQNLRKKLIQKDVEHIQACRQCDLPWSSGTSRWRVKYMLSSLVRR